MDCCIVCLQPNCDLFSRIHIDSSEWNRAQIQRVVEKHFWWWYIKPQAEDSNIKWICNHCWQQISSFHDFYLKVENAHKQYETLLVDTKMSKVKSENMLECNEQPFYYKIESVNTNFESECGEQDKNNELILNADIKTEQIYDEFEVNEDIIQVKQEPLDNTLDDDIDDDIDDDTDYGIDDDMDDDIDDDIVYASSSKKQNCKSKNNIISGKYKLENVLLGRLKRNEIIDFYEEFQFKLECIICTSTASTFANLCAHYKKKHKMPGFAICCGVKFYKRHLLMDHLCVHKDPNFFQCDKCDRVYRSRDSLHLHLRKLRCVNNSHFKCDECGKLCLYEKNLKRHKLIHLGPANTTTNLNISNYQETNDKNIAETILGINEDTILPKIKTEPSDIGEMPMHIIEEYGKSEYGENSEDDSISNKNERNDTSKRKDGKKMYAPSVGDDFFHEMQYTMKCFDCNIILPEFRSLMSHFRKVHNRPGYGVCCGKKYYKRGKLADHLRLHKNPNLFQCHLCEKKLNSRHGFERHMEFCIKKFEVD